MSVIKEWQELIGSFLGASIPIVFWFFVRYVESRSDRKESLLYMQKNLVQNINMLIDTNDTLRKFVKTQLGDLKKNVKQRISEKQYSADRCYLPNFSASVVADEIVSRSSGSGYIDNKMLQIHTLTKEISVGINDIRNQFNDTVVLHMNMAFSKMNPAELHNREYLRNIEDFEAVLSRDIFNQNIPVAIKLFTDTLVAIEYLNEIGLYRWKYKFSGRSFKVFKTKKSFVEFGKNAHERIAKFLLPKFDLRMKEINEKLNSEVI